jgi:hypothetical protein
MACHLLTHRLAVNRPYIDFSTVDRAPGFSDSSAAAGNPVSVGSTHAGILEGFQWLLHSAEPIDGDQKRDFVIRGSSSGRI